MIFPERVLGMSGTMITWRGLAIPPIPETTAAETRSAISADAAKSGFNAIYRSGTLPLTGSATGTTAASTTSGTKQRRRLDLLGAEAVAGDVDDVVDSAKDAVVAVGRLHRAVARHVRPVAPVLAVGILAVARVVLFHVASSSFHQ